MDKLKKDRQNWRNCQIIDVQKRNRCLSSKGSITYRMPYLCTSKVCYPYPSTHIGTICCANWKWWRRFRNRTKRSIHRPSSSTRTFVWWTSPDDFSHRKSVGWKFFFVPFSEMMKKKSLLFFWLCTNPDFQRRRNQIVSVFLLST